VSTKGNGNDEELPAAVAPEASEGALEAAGTPAGEDRPAEQNGLAERPAGDEAEALRRECAELREALLRRRADFENYRRRVERDRGTAAAEAEADVLRPILGTVDNLERALSAKGAEAGLREGVELTHRELKTLLESLGVREIDPLGQRFDPALQQAILHEPAPGFEPGTVAEVYRKGFTYKDRLLRPALVKVASEGGGSGEDRGGSDVQ
jgi:molecular chaperone GrpE